MGLLQKACETYDTHSNLAGLEREGHAMLLPVSHIMTTANIEITINAEGKFVSARLIGKDEPKIAIPVTEESAGRTSSPCAHPLSDQVQYVVNYNSDKHMAYIEQLAGFHDMQDEFKKIKKDSDVHRVKNSLYINNVKSWAESKYSHEKVRAINQYLQKDTILSDLVNSNCIKLTEEGIPQKCKDIVCWSVLGVTNSGPTWLDTSLFEAYIMYYQNTQSETEKDLCMISGDTAIPSEQHPKGIISLYGNAKIISANDSSNFTYRGRFSTSSQAVSISYISSQKAHNALRWLAEEQSCRDIFGGRTMICWNPNGKKIIKPTNPLIRRETNYIIVPSSYKEELRNTIVSFKADNQLNGNETIVVVALDAATTGRLSVTYYSEHNINNFIEKMSYWDETSAWNHSFRGVQSPPLWDYIDCAFGTERKGKFETDDKVKAQQMQRLISVKIDGGLFPADIEKSLVNKASNLLVLEKTNREKMLFTACSAVRKYRKDRFREDWDMSLDPNKKDISYQYGRLLAVMEKIESDTYSNGSERETNAIRLQSIFSRRPQYATRIIMEQLKKVYIPRLSKVSQNYYEKLIGEIMEEISVFSDDDQRKTLGDTYLLGYYLQRNSLYTKKENMEDKE